MRSGDQSGDEVESARHDDHAERVRQGRVGEHATPEPGVAQSGVGYLVAHADSEGDVGEVVIAGPFLPGRVVEGYARGSGCEVQVAQGRVQTVLTRVQDNITVSTGRPVSSPRSRRQRAGLHKFVKAIRSGPL